MSEDHHVHPRGCVELEEDPDVLPNSEGLLVATSLDDPPEGRGELVELHPEVPFEGLEGGMLEVLQDPQAHVLHLPGLLLLERSSEVLPLALAEALLEALAVPTGHREALWRCRWEALREGLKRTLEELPEELAAETLR